MQKLKEVIKESFPNDKCNMQPELRQFWDVRDPLASDADDGLIVLGHWIVIPKILRKSILQDLVQMHQGATKLRQRARLSLYWPGMENNVKNASEACNECAKGLPSHGAEPLQQRMGATRPFEQIHADFCSVNGRHYLVTVDQYSGWPHVVPFLDENTIARRLINAFC